MPQPVFPVFPDAGGWHHDQHPRNLAGLLQFLNVLYGNLRFSRSCRTYDKRCVDAVRTGQVHLLQEALLVGIKGKRTGTLKQVGIAESALRSKKGADHVNGLVFKTKVLKRKTEGLKAQNAQCILLFKLMLVGLQTYNLRMVVSHSVFFNGKNARGRLDHIIHEGVFPIRHGNGIFFLSEIQCIRTIRIDKQVLKLLFQRCIVNMYLVKESAFIQDFHVSGVCRHPAMNLLRQTFLWAAVAIIIFKKRKILFGNIKPEKPVGRHHPCILHFTVFGIIEQSLIVLCPAQVEIQNDAVL